MQETKDAIGWKLYSALSSDAFRQMFGTANKNSINFDDLIAARKVVLVRATKDGLGEDGQRVSFSTSSRSISLPDCGELGCRNRSVISISSLVTRQAYGQLTYYREYLF